MYGCWSIELQELIKQKLTKTSKNSGIRMMLCCISDLSSHLIKGRLEDVPEVDSIRRCVLSEVERTTCSLGGNDESATKRVGAFVTSAHCSNLSLMASVMVQPDITEWSIRVRRCMGQGHLCRNNRVLALVIYEYWAL